MRPPEYRSAISNRMTTGNRSLPNRNRMNQSQPKKQRVTSFPLPHQRESRLTLGEIQAIKNMRANPNIPKDAKPELPEGYE